MIRQRTALGVAAAVLFSSLCAAFGGAQITDRAIPLGGANAMRLDVSGSIHLIADASARDVAFHVVDNGPSIPPMTVKTGHTGKRLDVSITGPSQNILPFVGASGYELEVRYPPSLIVDLREFSGRVHVDRVGAPMQIYDADGNIVVDDAPAPLTAQADSGDIAVIGAGARLMLSTITGNVSATIGRGFSGKLVRLEAETGNLTLSVPAGFAGHYDLTSADGHVSNQLHNDPRGPLVFMLAEQGNVSVGRL
jgi:hypothetical protein